MDVKVCGGADGSRVGSRDVGRSGRRDMGEPRGGGRSHRARKRSPQRRTLHKLRPELVERLRLSQHPVKGDGFGRRSGSPQVGVWKGGGVGRRERQVARVQQVCMQEKN